MIYCINQFPDRSPDILRTAQEGQSGDLSASVSPLADAPGDLDMRQIHSRWTRNPGKPDKQRRTRGHVPVLHARSGRSRVPKVPVVEEAPDDRATRKFFRAPFEKKKKKISQYFSKFLASFAGLNSDYSYFIYLEILQRN